jgi:DNA-binding SARP family transcriptional activator/tetratricopeptide (TPR) repeat protein
MSEFPVQVSKIQPPPLRDQTLARDRLLDWLGAKIHDRVVLVIAEAGYGKTTLMADFSRRTRLRSLWYRLDRGDRDWVGFIAHLAAAVRAHVPDFGPATDTLLRETATAAPPLDTVLDTFLRELASLPLDPSVLVFDDFHLVDDTPEIRHVVKELLARAPERLTFVFVSRRVPPVPLARLRALGEVAEIGTDDLRFDPAETERLFRETYEMALDPSLISELSRRTEGWAASLQLVRAALHDRDPVQARAFISSLSGAEGHLYDYLAEEVIGDLPAPLQNFLMRTSILETIDLELGPIAADVPASTAKTFIEEAERLGLLARRGSRRQIQVRSHPLVREFLRARLARQFKPKAIEDMHRQIARAAQTDDWRAAVSHFLAANDEAEARQVLSTSIERILATGAYAAGQDFAGLLAGGLEGAAGLILQSRIAQQRGDVSEGLVLAERAHHVDPSSRAGLLNLITARHLAGDIDAAVDIGHLLGTGQDDLLAKIGRCYQTVMATSLEGSIDLAVREAEDLAQILESRSDLHYLGVTRLNLALLEIATGDIDAAAANARQAIAFLSQTSAGVELTTAYTSVAWCLAYSGEIGAARRELANCLRIAPPGQAAEIAVDTAYIEATFGDPAAAWSQIRGLGEQIDGARDIGAQVLLARALLEIRAGDPDSGAAYLSRIEPGRLRSMPAFELRRRLAEAELAVLSKGPNASRLANDAVRLAVQQGARFWESSARLLLAIAGREDLSHVVEQVGMARQAALSVVAEAVLGRAEDLSDAATAIVGAEAERLRSRWLPPLRSQLQQGSQRHQISIAMILGRVGEQQDIRRLREASRTIKDHRISALPRLLARRLASRVLVEDLGRVRLRISDHEVEGTEIRRKVLGLLCLLLTMPGFSSTREQVLEQLWPDLDPASALNSLNQTVYFLRRVFEPNYREDVSPIYVHQDGETIWLDQDLIESRSARCRALIDAASRYPTPEQAAQLAAEYQGRFALDFAYEDWAASFRDQLHSAYLRVMEQAIRMDIDSGHVSRGTVLAERAAAVEPDSDEIQVALIRLYRLSGAHAAAAEQYAHYSRTLREIGVEPPALAEV